MRAGGYSGGPVDRKGECVTAPGLGHHLCCSWRQDNGGPHSPDEVRFELINLVLELSANVLW